MVRFYSVNVIDPVHGYSTFLPVYCECGEEVTDEDVKNLVRRDYEDYEDDLERAVVSEIEEEEYMNALAIRVTKRLTHGYMMMLGEDSEDGFKQSLITSIYTHDQIDKLYRKMIIEKRTELFELYGKMGRAVYERQDGDKFTFTTEKDGLVGSVEVYPVNYKSNEMYIVTVDNLIDGEHSWSVSANVYYEYSEALDEFERLKKLNLKDIKFTHTEETEGYYYGYGRTDLDSDYLTVSVETVKL